MEKSITVKEYFDRRAKGETVKGIAEELGKSPKALNRSLERLGYIANDKNEWIYQGAEVENLDQLLPFGRGQSIPKGKNDSTNKNKTTKTSEKAINSKGDSNSKLDQLLKGKTNKSDKGYIGFYLDHDVIEATKKIPTGNRSELVNELLKQFFKDKGLL